MAKIIYIGINWRSLGINDRPHIKMNSQKHEARRASTGFKRFGIKTSNPLGSKTAVKFSSCSVTTRFPEITVFEIVSYDLR
jgi:hypothetical protein